MNFLSQNNSYVLTNMTTESRIRNNIFKFPRKLENDKDT